MNRVRGRVIVRETGAGIGGLLVAAYHVDSVVEWERSDLPGSGEAGGARRDVHEGIAGSRLGSVLTDERGEFELAYGDEAFRAKGEAGRPNLAVLVLAPEDAGDEPCPRVLHTSCAVRPDAGRTETFLIRLPLESLREPRIRAGADTAAVVHGFRPGALLTRMTGLADEQRQEQESGERFSVRYRSRREDLADAIRGAARQEGEPRPGESFGLALPVRLTGREDTIPGARVLHDEEGGVSLRVPGADPVPLDFAGVRYIPRANDDVPPGRHSWFVADPDRRELRIAVVRSPSKLLLPDAAPGELERYYFNRRRHRGEQRLPEDRAENPVVEEERDHAE